MQGPRAIDTAGAVGRRLRDVAIWGKVAARGRGICT